MKQKLALIFLSSLMFTISVVHVFAASDDFDVVTKHINIAPIQELSILYPTKDIQTTADGFQITGTSDPGKTLTLNGKTVDDRGAGGTFAVYVPLKNGENPFMFRQENISATITITKGMTDSASTAATNAANLPKPLPEYDLALKSGRAFSFQCYAPNATTVTATINGKDYKLAANGSYFSGSYSIPSVNGTVELGAITYTITDADGTYTKISEGGLFAVGKDDILQIQVKSVSATIFEEASPSSTFITTAKQGATDQVVEYNGDLYQLATGGWIMARAVQPLVSKMWADNTVHAISYHSYSDMEVFTFHGNSHPIYRASHTDSTLQITLCGTTDIGKIDVSDSNLFSDVRVSEKGGHSTLEFPLSIPGSLWGYLVEYRDGDTILSCRYRPKLPGDGHPPLTGITVAVDAGHGGSDPGALGVTYGHGIVEKDITLVTAIALQKKLELLGAEVIMLRQDDSTIDLNSRLATAQAARVDFLISIHANSVGFSRTAAAANGVEVYYYEPISKVLAQNITAGISDSTGRKPRGAKQTNFMMTLNSYAPCILVEMGFLLNPSDFDSMCSKEGIYNTVTAISDGIVTALKR